MKVPIKNSPSTWVLAELVALLQGKYHFESTFNYRETRISYEVKKPNFSLRTYDDKDVGRYSKVYELQLGYLKVTRHRY